jgi:hypothetical protein
MMQSELIKESVTGAARQTIQRDKGIVVGGAEPRLFANGDRCIRVVAEDTDGNVLPPENGPFPLAPPKRPLKGPFCVTKDAPGFLLSGVAPGGLIVLLEGEDGSLRRMHYVNTGENRASILVN